MEWKIQMLIQILKKHTSKIFTRFFSNYSILLIQEFSNYAGTTTGWTGTQIDFLQLLNHKIFQKVILVSFLHLSKLCIFAKLGGCGSKTKPATPSRSLKWFWREIHFECS